jgi:hypothetical protein
MTDFRTALMRARARPPSLVRRIVRWTRINACAVQVVVAKNESGQWPRLLCIITVVLPLLLMPATERHGVGEFINST